MNAGRGMPTETKLDTAFFDFLENLEKPTKHRLFSRMENTNEENMFFTDAITLRALIHLIFSSEPTGRTFTIRWLKEGSAEIEREEKSITKQNLRKEKLNEYENCTYPDNTEYIALQNNLASKKVALARFLVWAQLEKLGLISIDQSSDTTI